MAASSSHGASSSSSSSPCAACKFLRRKCTSECVFAPYFPPDQPQKFSNVHKIFGASNVTKILSDLPDESRLDAVNSLAFEADARMKDPVYGCVGAISNTQQRISVLKTEIEILQERIEKLNEKGIKMPNTETLGLPSESVGLGTGDDQGPRATAPDLQIAGVLLGLPLQSFLIDTLSPQQLDQKNRLQAGYAIASNRTCSRQ